MTECDLEKPLKGMNFVLSGSLSSKGKAVTHNKYKQTIQEHGGTVRDSVPFRNKSVSSKKYIVVSSEKTVKKVPATILHAIRRGFTVVNSSYALDVIEGKKKLCPGKYLIETKHLKGKITKDISVARRHFAKAKSLKSMLRKKRQKVAGSRKDIPKHPRYVNPATYYVALQLKRDTIGKSPKERRNLFAKSYEALEQSKSARDRPDFL